jgi:predicted RND superfamily exporter protein
MKLKSDLNAAGDMSIGKIIGIIVVVIVAMALLPTLITSVNSGYWATNGSTYSSAHALIPLVVLFFVLAIIVAAVMWVVHETRGKL